MLRGMTWPAPIRKSKLAWKLPPQHPSPDSISVRVLEGTQSIRNWLENIICVPVMLEYTELMLAAVAKDQHDPHVRWCRTGM